MHALAKMAEMAINRRNRQTVNKNSNELAKGPFGNRRFWRKWRLRWLDTVFLGQYLPSLSINYVAINKVLEKLPLQLY